MKYSPRHRAGRRSVPGDGAESILIERMAGKSTVGIQVPNHERETIWLRDVVEDESFAQTKIKLTARDGQGHQRPHRAPPIWPPCRTC